MILSVDIGITNYGWAVIDNSGSHIASGSLIASDSQLIHKLVRIYGEFKNLIEMYNINVIAYEEPVFMNRGSNGAVINQCLGVLLLLAGQYKLRLFGYTPSQVKKKLTNNGKADKKEIMEAVTNYYPQLTKFSSDHESDAIAVGICYLSNNNLI